MYAGLIILVVVFEFCFLCLRVAVSRAGRESVLQEISHLSSSVSVKAHILGWLSPECQAVVDFEVNINEQSSRCSESCAVIKLLA